MAMLEGGFSLEIGAGGNGTLSVQTQSALLFFNNFAVSLTDKYARQLGLYADVTMGRDLQARFASFAATDHLLRSRANACTWNPVKGLVLDIEVFPTCAVEYDGEQCPDAFYGTCFERLFAPGSTNPLGSTPEAQAVINLMLERIYLGLSNSFFSLYNFAKHPLIEASNTAASYAVTEEEFGNYYAQQMAGDCGGLITQLDALKDVPQYQKYYNLTIATGATGVDLTTNKYIGDITDLFRTLEAAASPKLQIAIDQGVIVGGVTRYPIILLATPEFNAYKKYLTDMSPTNELAYRFMIENQDGSSSLVQNVLMFNSMPVIQWTAFTQLDGILGTKSHRAAIIAPGNFGVLSNVGDINSRLLSGTGLIVQESPLIKDKGKIYMHTNFRWGAAIANPEMGVMASLTISPIN